eukprot:5282062-Heterocapsa_arctica.AAC.1
MGSRVLRAGPYGAGRAQLQILAPGFGRARSAQPGPGATELTGLEIFEFPKHICSPRSGPYDAKGVQRQDLTPGFGPFRRAHPERRAKVLAGK